MLRNHFMLLAAAMLAALLAGCVSAPERQAFNPVAVPQLKTIKVLPMRPAEPTVVIMNHPGYQFGLVGVLVAEGHMAPKRARLREHLRQAGFSQSETFRRALDEALGARGYAIAWPETLEEPSKSPRDRWGRRKAVAAVDDADAQLDISFNFLGYAAAGATDSAPYRPTLSMSATLVGADGRTRLFQDSFVYNNVFNSGYAVVVEADPRYTYPDSDDMEQAGAQTVEGLEAAVRSIAAKIAEQLGS